VCGARLGKPGAPSKKAFSKRRRIVVAGVAILMVVSTGAGWWVLARSHDVRSPPLTEKTAAILADELVSQDPAVARRAYSGAVLSGIEGKESSLLPAGAKVSVDTATFQELGKGIAQVDASVTGSAAGSWRLHLVYEGGRWVIFDTEPLGPGP